LRPTPAEPASAASGIAQLMADPTASAYPL
jgi:hypothetical protein